MGFLLWLLQCFCVLWCSSWYLIRYIKILSNWSISLVLLNIPGSELTQLAHQHDSLLAEILSLLLPSSFPRCLIEGGSTCSGKSHLVLCCRMWLVIDQTVLGNKRLELTGCQINSSLPLLPLSVCLTQSLCVCVCIFIVYLHYIFENSSLYLLFG